MNFIHNRQVLEQALILLHDEGRPIRQLSRQFHLGRNAIRRILRDHAQRPDSGHEVLTKRLPRASKLDGFDLDIKKMLENYPDMTGLRIYEELKEAGYSGGISILRERLKKLRIPKREPVIQFKTERARQERQKALPKITQRPLDQYSELQIATELKTSRKMVTRVLKEKTILLRYQIKLEYLGEESEGNTKPLKGWFREILINADMTLNELNDFIQQVLGWDNTHLYIFTIHDMRYAYLGEDGSFNVEVVEDSFENHRSTKIPIYLVGLCENDQFFYYTDFGDDHLFLLTVSRIEKRTNGDCLPMVIGSMGKNLIQYEPQDCGKKLPSRVEYTEPDGYKAYLPPPKALKFRRNDTFKVDFIVGKDKDILDKHAIGGRIGGRSGKCALLDFALHFSNSLADCGRAHP